VLLELLARRDQHSPWAISDTVDAVKDEIKFPLVLKATKPEIKRLGEYRPEETSQQNF
jgi:hypothetical protein